MMSPQQNVPQYRSDWDDIKLSVKTLATCVTILMLFIAVASIIAMYVGIPEVISVWNYPQWIFIVTIGIEQLFVLDNSTLALYLIFLAIVTVSIIMLIKNSRVALVQELKMKPVHEHSPLYMAGTLIMAMFVVTIIFQIIIPGITGQSSSSPSYSNLEHWQLLYRSAEAPVWEEIITRVLLLGIPLMIVDVIRKAVNDSEMKPLRRYILGGGFKFGKAELLFLIISSILFGYAHLGSWDFFKIIPATAAGFAMGYMYLKFGLYASISMHAINNLLGFSTLLIPSGWMNTVVALTSLGMLAFGVAYLPNYVIKIIKWASTSLSTKKVRNACPVIAGESPIDESAEDINDLESQEIKFKCNNCGNESAVIENGEVVCTKCRSKTK